MKPVSPFTEQFIPTELLKKHFVKTGTYGYLPLIARDGNTHLFYWCEHWENLVPIGSMLKDFDRPELTFKVTKHIKDPSADDDCIIVCEGTSTDDDLQVLETHLTYRNENGQLNISRKDYSIATGMGLDNSNLTWAGGYSHLISRTCKTEIVQGMVEAGDSGKIVWGIAKNSRKLVCVGSNEAFTGGDQTNLRWSSCYFSIEYAKTLGYKGFKMLDEPLLSWDESFRNRTVEDILSEYVDFEPLPNTAPVEPTPEPDPIVDSEPTTEPEPVEETPEPVTTMFEYSHFMWTITKRRDSTSNSIQASEFEILIDGERAPFTNCEIVALDNKSPSAEQPVKLIDGSVGSKWLDFNFTDQTSRVGESCAIIRTKDGSKLSFNGYNWKTANDAIGRDPISWKLECSNDGEVWDLIDSVEDYTVTETRRSSVGPWTLVAVEEPTEPTPEPEPEPTEPTPEPLTLEQRVTLLEEKVKTLEDSLKI